MPCHLKIWNDKGKQWNRSEKKKLDQKKISLIFSVFKTRWWISLPRPPRTAAGATFKYIIVRNKGLHPHRRQSTQVFWTAGKNPVSAKMKNHYQSLTKCNI